MGLEYKDRTSAGKRRDLCWLPWIFVLAVVPVGAATLTVTSVSDDPNTVGCTLREAIQAANGNLTNECGTGQATPIVDRIHFAIPGGSGVRTITPVGSELPALTDRVFIDGTTQVLGGVTPDCANGVLRVQVDGAAIAALPSPELLQLQAGSGGSTIRGLVLSGNRSGPAIEIQGSDNNVIQCNFVGTDPTGLVSAANFYGINIRTDDNIIGTNGDGINDAAEGNLISGNSLAGGASAIGIRISGGGRNKVSGNRIGTNWAGTAAVPNELGIEISGLGARDNVIGTDGDVLAAAAEMNLISGQLETGGISGLIGWGIRIGGLDPNDVDSGTRVAGNRIGTDWTGTLAIPNQRGGIYVLNASGNVIGTNGDGLGDTVEGNLISGHTDGRGILLDTDRNEARTRFNRVAGNRIGTNAAGTAALPNLSGVQISGGADFNVIGTNADGLSDGPESNLISGNFGSGIAGNGVFVNCNSTRIDELAHPGCVGNQIKGNRIGTSFDGFSAVGNVAGVRVGMANTDTVIGTDGDGIRDSIEGNLLSGNGLYGISLIPGAGDTQAARRTRISGNRIGTDPTGLGVVPNGNNGVAIQNRAIDTLVGTDGNGISDALERNLISGNDENGVLEISGPNDRPSGTIIAGNWIGVDATGQAVLGNGRNGISIGATLATGPGDTRIGSNDVPPNPDEANVIAGHNSTVVGRGQGITVDGSPAQITNLRIAGNFIGTDPSGTLAFPNTVGVRIEEGPQILFRYNRVQSHQEIPGVLLSGYAISARDGTTFVAGSEQNCIVGNTLGVGIAGLSPGTPAVFINNWWGAATGPSGEGPGSGDPVDVNIDFDPFLSAPPPGCPTLGLPVVSKEFHTRRMPLGGTTGLTIEILNNTLGAFTDLGFTDGLPTVLRVASPSGAMLGGDCGDGLFSSTPLPGDTQFSVQGIDVPIGGTCTIQLTVVGVSVGTGTNQVTLDAPFAQVSSGVAQIEIQALASLGDFVWRDADGDGSQDPNEAGVEGVQVRLLESSGLAQVDLSTTNSAGQYQFLDIAPGTYVVEFVLPANGFLFTAKDQGGDEGLDSDAVPGTGRTDAIVLGSGDARSNVDAGLVPTAAVGNFVWSDDGSGGGTADDGIQDPNEPGLPNVTVHLLHPNNGTTLDTEVTGPAGDYRFAELPAGDYRLAIEVPAGYLNSPQNSGLNDGLDSDFDPGSRRTEIFNLVPAQEDTTQDAGLVAGASIEGRAWDDEGAGGGTSYNGIREPNEPGLAGIEVRLLDEAGLPTGRMDTTDSSGHYQIVGLRPNQYILEFVLPDGRILAPQDQGVDEGLDSDANEITGRTAILAALPGAMVTSVDAGLVRSASLGDRVWLDDGAGGGIAYDGIQDPNEPGIAGIAVYLLDGQGNATGQSTSTGPTGLYRFEGLAPVAYQVRFEAPAGMVLVPRDQGLDDALDSDADPQTGITGPISLNLDEERLDVDAGLVAAASVGDRVFRDLNGDGIQDPNEPGVAQVTIHLLDGAGTATGHTEISDAAGHFNFSGLRPGGYRLEVELPGGFLFSPRDQGGDEALDSDVEPTNGRTDVLTLGPGESRTNVDAGLVPAGSVGDRVFLDLDADGLQDPNEPGASGIVVRLLDAGGTPTGDMTTTSDDGAYVFEDLPAGEVIVEVVEPAGFDFSPRDQGPDDGQDSDLDPVSGRSGILTLEIGQQRTDVDAGLVPLARLGDRMFLDTNGSGLQDNGEPGRSSGAVRLLDGSGQPTGRTTTTDPQGVYVFEDVRPGTYIIEFDAVQGFAFTTRDAGSDDIDSDVDPQTGRTNPLILNPGQLRTDVDAGLVQLGSIGDRVWMDTDGDGLQDSNEPGVAGIAVELLDASGQATGRMETTDALGAYVFGGLTPGSYIVQFLSPRDLRFSPRQAGTADLDSDPFPDSGRTAVLALTPGQIRTDVDAGLAPLAPTVGAPGHWMCLGLGLALVSLAAPGLARRRRWQSAAGGGLLALLFLMVGGLPRQAQAAGLILDAEQLPSAGGSPPSRIGLKFADDTLQIHLDGRLYDTRPLEGLDDVEVIGSGRTASGTAHGGRGCAGVLELDAGAQPNSIRIADAVLPADGQNQIDISGITHVTFSNFPCLFLNGNIQQDQFNLELLDTALPSTPPSNFALSLVQFYGGGDDDRFNIPVLPGSVQLVLRGEAGVDRFDLYDPNTSALDGLLGSITVDGGGDGDVLTLLDTGSFGPSESLVLTGSTILGLTGAGGAGQPVSYQNLGAGQLVLSANGAGHSVTVLGTATGLGSTTLRTGTGGDSVTLQMPDAGVLSLDLDGQAGADSLEVLGTSQDDGFSVDLQDSRLGAALGLGPVNFTSFEALSFDGAAGGLDVLDLAATGQAESLVYIPALSSAMSRVGGFDAGQTEVTEVGFTRIEDFAIRGSALPGGPDQLSIRTQADPVLAMASQITVGNRVPVRFSAIDSGVLDPEAGLLPALSLQLAAAGGQVDLSSGSTADAGRFQFSGQPPFRFEHLPGSAPLQIDGSTGNDRLRLLLPPGTVMLQAALGFTGAGQSTEDVLEVASAGGAPLVSIEHEARGPGQGSIDFGAGLPVQYSGLERVEDLREADLLRFRTPADSADRLAFEDGAVLPGSHQVRSLSGGFTTTELEHKGAVLLRTDQGAADLDDRVELSATRSTGLTAFQVQTGAANDTVLLRLPFAGGLPLGLVQLEGGVTGEGNRLDLQGPPGSTAESFLADRSRIEVQGLQSVDYTGFDSLLLATGNGADSVRVLLEGLGVPGLFVVDGSDGAGATTLELVGTRGDDLWRVTPADPTAAAPAPGQPGDTVFRLGAAGLQVRSRDVLDPLRLRDGGGNDHLEVLARSSTGLGGVPEVGDGADQVSVLGGGAARVSISNATQGPLPTLHVAADEMTEGIRLVGGNEAGGDLFTIEPSVARTIEVQGGLPQLPTTSGDRLQLALQGVAGPPLYAPTSADSGSVLFQGRQTVQYFSIEGLEAPVRTALCSRSDGCFRWELIEADLSRTEASFGWRVTNLCDAPLQRVDLRFVPGIQVISPSDTAEVRTRRGLYQSLRIGGPHAGIAFQPIDVTLGRDASDEFFFTVDRTALQPDTVLWNSATTTAGQSGRMDMTSSLCFPLPLETVREVSGHPEPAAWFLLCLGLATVLQRLRLPRS